MSVHMDLVKSNTGSVNAHQVCARGWQDYMIETMYFLGESRVDDCLKTFTTRQLEKLGLKKADEQLLRAR